MTEEDKHEEVVDESDKELIRVARGDVDEDEEPREKSHKEKKRSTEGELTVRLLELQSWINLAETNAKRARISLFF